MRRIVAAALLLTTLTAIGAGDVLQSLKIKPADASQELISSLVNGNVNTWRVREVFKPASEFAQAWLKEM